MFKKVMTIGATLAVGISLLGFSPLAHAATGGTKDAVCEGIGIGSGEPGDCNTAPSDSPSVEGVVHTVISILSWLIGVIAVIVLILGGFKYITSGGDSGKVTSAKSTITYALIGLVIAVLAQVLVRYVITTATVPASTLPAGCQSNTQCGNKN